RRYQSDLQPLRRNTNEPLWVIFVGSAHSERPRDVPLRSESGQTRRHRAKSALCQKRTFASQQKSPLFESRPPERGASRSHRTINAGTLQWVSTSYAWLPSNSRETPRRPCEAMTIKSHPFSLAVATIPSAGC